MKASKLVIGVGCLALSLGAMADQSGGLEGMIDQMEKHGATHDLQMGMPSFGHSGADGAGAEASDTPSENPITHVITPARPALTVQPGTPPASGVTATTDPSGNPRSPVSASPGAQRTASTPTVAAQPVIAAAPPEPPRHNPLADQPRASGGLEQIIDIMELNASSPMRPSTPSAPPKPGVSQEASLREQMAR